MLIGRIWNIHDIILCRNVGHGLTWRIIRNSTGPVMRQFSSHILLPWNVPAKLVMLNWRYLLRAFEVFKLSSTLIVFF